MRLIAGPSIVYADWPMNRRPIQMNTVRTSVTACVFSAAFVAFVVGCVGTQPPVIPQNLDTYEGLAAAIESNADILIYDVRSADEYAGGFIHGSINVPHSVIADRLSREYRDRVIVVYGQSGVRSRTAYEALTEKGFTHVFDFGGIGNWQGDMEYDCGCPYN